MTQIDAYDFGRISVGGTTYVTDVIVTPDGVRDGWRRRQGHQLHIEDLNSVLASSPEVLVVGTGCYGRMTVPEETRCYLKSKEVQLIAIPTSQAVDEFNRLQRDYAAVVAALHVTC